jgi:hypothetical protein
MWDERMAIFQRKELKFDRWEFYFTEMGRGVLARFAKEDRVTELVSFTTRARRIIFRPRGLAGDRKGKCEDRTNRKKCKESLFDGDLGRFAKVWIDLSTWDYQKDNASADTSVTPIYKFHVKLEQILNYIFHPEIGSASKINPLQVK